jgi:PTH1 family peptidyl-tRNA hydrolase
MVVRAVIGLGNPGQKYAHTRHNLGFMVVDELIKRLQAGSPRDRFKSQVWEARHNDERIALVKPQTYMNLSGISVQQVRSWYKLDNDQILVIYDDVDLEFGILRLKTDGSAGGHNGLSSIIQALGTSQIPRLRIGIGRGRSATTAHVLSGFTGAEEAELSGLVKKAADAAMLWMREGPTIAMNQVNQRPVQSGARKSSTAELEAKRAPDDDRDQETA